MSDDQDRPSSSDPPADPDVEPEPVEPHSYEGEPGALSTDTRALIVKDCNPWYAAANESVLSDFGVPYDVITSSMLSGRSLDDYGMVVLPSTQSGGYYSNLHSASGKLASFVDDGGVLVAHVADGGYPCTTRWSGSFLPGGVTKSSRHWDDLSVVDSSHPLLDNVNPGELDGWNSSTHGYLRNVPSSATVVAGFGFGFDPTDRPTYVEYEHGSGVVLATMQTMEWPFYQSVYGTKQLLRNELSYALGLDGGGGGVEVDAQMTTLSFFPGLNENSSEGGDELNSALPHISDTAPVIDDWFHGDFRTELEDDLDDATFPDKELEEFPDASFKHVRFENQVEVEFTVDDDGSIDPASVSVDANDDTSFITLEGEGNPLRAPGVNDLLFGGDDVKPATPRPRYVSWELTEVDGVDAVRVSTIWGAFDPYVEIMLEYVADNSMILLAWLLGVPLAGQAAAFISTTPTIYTWNELTVTAEGARLARVWDASRFPGHAGYLEGTKRDEVPFEQGVHWEPQERFNGRFNTWVAEEQTHAIVPYESPHVAYLSLFDDGAGPHPVMAYGTDEDGDPLSESQVLARLPDDPLDPF